jgi:hypothetical protein
VVANELDTALVAQLAVPIKFPVKEPEKLPVLICNELDTVPAGSIVGAKEAVVANDAVDGTNVIEVAAEDVVANEALIELFDQLLVPIKFPVNDPLKLPVLICSELETVPAGKNAVTCVELDTMFTGILERPV